LDNLFTITKDAIVKIVENYTRESGVRNLERLIGKVVRYVAKSVAMEDVYQKRINSAMVKEILGAERFDKELYEDNNTSGVVTGLAWTQVGGEILFIESSLSRGKGKLTLSGQLGDVMKESAMAALSYLKSNADKLAIDFLVTPFSVRWVDILAYLRIFTANRTITITPNTYVAICSHKLLSTYVLQEYFQADGNKIDQGITVLSRGIPWGTYSEV